MERAITEAGPPVATASQGLPVAVAHGDLVIDGHVGGAGGAIGVGPGEPVARLIKRFAGSHGVGRAISDVADVGSTAGSAHDTGVCAMFPEAVFTHGGQTGERELCRTVVRVVIAHRAKITELGAAVVTVTNALINPKPNSPRELEFKFPKSLLYCVL